MSGPPEAGRRRNRPIWDRWGRLRIASRQPVQPKVRTAVVTDSAAGLPAAWLAEAEDAPWFEMVPLSVLAGEEIFADGPEAEAALGIALAAGRPVKTSRPAPGVFERIYRNLESRGFAAVASIHLSGALSGTVDAARLAAEKVGIPVHVLDTRTAGLAQGFAVQSAAAAARAGEAPDAVLTAARRALADAEVRFFLPSLEQLRRGGRIGAAASWVGTMLSIKPLLAIRDGQIVPIERIRTAARAIPRLVELTIRDARTRGEPRLAVHYFGNRSEADAIAGQLRQALGGDADVVVSPLPGSLAAHTGVGVLGVVVTGTRQGDDSPSTDTPFGLLST
ncbi:MAG TPA: DegV family protein [Sinomonas sp.]|nr:DegV family protein [Sinomonas sp.]